MPKVHWLRTELMRNNVLTNSGTHLLEPVRDGITTIFCICLRCLLYREITGSIRNDDSKMRYWERRRKWDTVRK